MGNTGTDHDRCDQYNTLNRHHKSQNRVEIRIKLHGNKNGGFLSLSANKNVKKVDNG